MTLGGDVNILLGGSGKLGKNDGLKNEKWKCLNCCGRQQMKESKDREVGFIDYTYIGIETQPDAIGGPRGCSIY